MQVNNRKNKILSFENYLCDIEMYCGVDLSEEKKSLKKSGESLLVLMNLASKLGVDPSQLFNQTIDLSILKNQLDPNAKAILKDKYSCAQYSSTTSLKTVLEQISKHTDSDFYLKKLQIKNDYLNIHRPLSILAVNDLLNYSAHFLTEKDFDDIGERNVSKFLGLEFGKCFSRTDTVFEIYEKVFHLSYLVEENWSYTLVKNKLHEIVVQTNQSEKMNDLIRGESYTNYLTNECRFSFLRHLVRKFGYQGVEITKLSENSDNDFNFKINLKNCTRPRSFSFDHGDLFQSGSPIGYGKVLPLQ